MPAFTLRFLIKICCFACLTVQVGAQQPFECDGKLYFVASNGPNSSLLLGISKDSSLKAQPVISTVAPDIAHKITAIGYNVRDNFIYGLERFSLNLIRIGSDGIVQNLGVPPNLDQNLEYFAGDVRPQGGALLVIGREPGGNDKALYTINLQPPHYAGLASIVSDEPVRIADMAIDPVFGSFVGFDEIKKRLVKLTTGGNVTSIHYEPQAQLGALGALFFDRWGNLYGVDSGGDQNERLVFFNKFNGTVKKYFEGPGGSTTDGCSCPYRIELYKKIEPEFVVPCSDVTVTYQFHNTAGIPYGQLTMEDEFPPTFVVKDVVKALPSSGTIDGFGTNTLEISGMEVLLDSNFFSIRVNVGEFSGTYAGQAWTSGLPLGLGVDLPSDNPRTFVIDDPTPLTVADTGSVILEREPKICPGSVATLTAAAGGQSYLWSNGATTATTTVSEPGLHWVEVQGDCGIYRDTVLVELATPPTINLGNDLTVPFGQTITLTYSTNATGMPAFFWSASGATLGCTACPNPQAELLTPATFSVTVTDANGCTATDELNVTVNETRKIFFPNAFSPNGDGLNDTFYPQAAGNFLIKHLRVYDRWGGMIFEKTDGQVNDPAAGWDGTARGKRVDFGVYLWEAEIEFPDGKPERFGGDVMLAR